MAIVTSLIPRVRVRRTYHSQLFQIRSQEDRKRCKTREQWLNQVQTQSTMCPTGTTHSTASTMIKEMGGVGGMG